MRQTDSHIRSWDQYAPPLNLRSTRAIVHKATIAILPCLALFALTGCGGSGANETADATPAQKPNIVVIMTDDQTVESMRVMPKTADLIGGHGTTFSNSFVSFPLCCPSRATFLTGQYAHNHGILNGGPPNGGYGKLDNNNTLPLWLQDAGYFTSHIGKYLNGYGEDDPAEVPPGWSHWQGLPDPGTYRMYDYRINDNGVLVTYGVSPNDYQTDVLAGRAEDTIDEALRKGQPFFLSIAPLAPHGEVSAGLIGFPNPRAAPRHASAYNEEPLPRPVSFYESDVSDKPERIRGLEALSASAISYIEGKYRSRLASLLAVDDLVERVVNKLDRVGVLNKTVLIFTSDMVSCTASTGLNLENSKYMRSPYACRCSFGAAVSQWEPRPVRSSPTSILPLRLFSSLVLVRVW